MRQGGSRKVLYQLALSGSAHRLFLFGTSFNNYRLTPNTVIPWAATTCAMDADCAPATSTAAAGIQSLRPVELGQAFCSGEWACNATGEWRSLWQEEEKSIRSRALYPARGRTVRSWFGPLPFLPIHIDPPALDTEAKRRRQAHQLATEQVYEPLRARAEEEQERKVPRSLRSKTTPRSVFPGKSPGMVCFRGLGQ
jgi:hypothetical protein